MTLNGVTMPRSASVDWKMATEHKTWSNQHFKMLNAQLRGKRLGRTGAKFGSVVGFSAPMRVCVCIPTERAGPHETVTWNLLSRLSLHQPATWLGTHAPFRHFRNANYSGFNFRCSSGSNSSGSCSGESPTSLLTWNCFKSDESGADDGTNYSAIESVESIPSECCCLLAFVFCLFTFWKIWLQLDKGAEEEEEEEAIIKLKWKVKWPRLLA